MIDIVLATFNGERYLKEQITSIQNNKCYSELVARLIIVDDGSTDKTEQIVYDLASLDSKIEWFKNSSGKHGPSHNFSFGLMQTTAQYIMLSDQDDFWLSEKILTSLYHLQSIEKVAEEVPLLVFSDKLIVDDKLQLICKSYFELKSIPKHWHLKFEQLCQQNVISGCAMMFNRALLKKALPIPEQAYMHDWWLALVASRTGKIKLIDQALIKYRQHENNSIGANKRSKRDLVYSFTLNFSQFESSFWKTVEQAKAFYLFEDKKHLPKNKTLEVLSNIHRYSKLKRIDFFVKKVITRSNFFGKVALILVLMKTHSTQIKENK
jgi:glycosyltransferase involved in cell wall biosynthesis